MDYLFGFISCEIDVAIYVFIFGYLWRFFEYLYEVM